MRSNRNVIIWQAIMDKKGKVFNVKEIVEETKAPQRSVYNYIRLLRGNLFIGLIEKGLYRQIVKQLDAPKFSRSGAVAGENVRQTLWRTMVMLKDFNIVHLVRSAGLASGEIKEDYARIYADDLVNVGIVMIGSCQVLMREDVLVKQDDGQTFLI